MTGMQSFSDAVSATTKVTLNILLRDVADHDRFMGLMPQGAKLLPRYKAAGVMDRDFGVRSVEVAAADLGAFLSAVEGAGISSCIYRVMRNALVPVTSAQAPSASIP